MISANNVTYRVGKKALFEDVNIPRQLPALRAEVTGQSVGSDASPLSCFLFRPRKRLEKHRKRSYTNASNASVIRTSSVSQTPLQTPIPYFHQWVPHGKKTLVAIACKTAHIRFCG